MSSEKNYQRQCPECLNEILFGLNYKPRVFKFYIDEAGDDMFEREDNYDTQFPEDPYLEIFCSWDHTHDVDGKFTEKEKDDIKANLIRMVKLEKLLKTDAIWEKQNKIEDIPEPTFNDGVEYFQKTHSHIQQVGESINKITQELQNRVLVHDKSKFEDIDEIKGFIGLNQDKKKNNFKFGSPEYKQALGKIQKVVDGHYSKNRHHPEYWDNGILDMDLVDVVEMFCDWTSACKRDKDGDIMKSIDICSKKFKIEPQLKAILVNTARRHFADKVWDEPAKKEK